MTHRGPSALAVSAWILSLSLLAGACSGHGTRAGRGEGRASSGTADAATVPAAAPATPAAEPVSVATGTALTEAAHPASAPPSGARAGTVTGSALGRPAAPPAPPVPVTAAAPAESSAARPAIPLAPTGEPPRRSILEEMPGYRPPSERGDPEYDAVARGRRLVGPIDAELQGGLGSAEDLARALLAALEADEADSLYRLCITKDEFAKILWPEFPQSRPATNIKATDAWFFQTDHIREGARNALDEWGGAFLSFDHIEYTVGLAPYTNFNLYKGVEIYARTVSGEEVVLTFAPIFVERHGKWKVYMLKG